MARGAASVPGSEEVQRSVKIGIHPRHAINGVIFAGSPAGDRSDSSYSTRSPNRESRDLRPGGSLLDRFHR